MKTDWLQMLINSVRFLGVAWRRLLSSSHRTQVAGNQSPHDEVGQITVRLHVTTVEGIGS